MKNGPHKLMQLLYEVGSANVMQNFDLQMVPVSALPA